MLRNFILIVLAFNCFALYPQTVTVLSSEDGKPLPDVAVYNGSRTHFCYTGQTGKAPLSGFSGDSLIYFQHFSHDLAAYTPAQLSQSGWLVKLTMKTFEVEEFIVSANRWEQKSDEVPNRITTLTLPSVRLQNPQTAADLISLSGDVFVQKSQLGGGSPMIRGFSTNRVLIVVDGVRMNNAIYREGNIQNVISLDPSVIDRTEIIFGPGATMYGSDALGGVMDFHTRRALLSTGDSMLFRAEAMARYSSANNEQTYHLDFNLGGSKLAFLSSVTWTDYDHLKMGSWQHSDYLRYEYQERTARGDTVIINPDPRVQVATGYSQINTMNKLRFRPGDHLDITFANHWSHLSDNPRYDRLIQKKNGALRYGDWYYGPQVWMMNDLSVRYTRSNRFFDEARLTVARQDYTESRNDRKFGDVTLNNQTEDVGIWSVNADFEKTPAKGKNLVYYGTEYNWNTIKSTAVTTDIETGVQEPAGSRYPNGKNIYNSFSLYGGYKHNLNEKLTFNAGLRYNFVSLSSEIADNSFYNFPFTSFETANSAVTGGAGAVWRPARGTELSANLSTGFRAPNLDDMGKVFESAPGVVIVPNPDLQPEYLYNADLGISHEFGRVLLADATVFFSYLDDAMVRRPFTFNGDSTIIYQGEESDVYAMVNAGYAIIYGTQIKAEIRPLRMIRIKSTLNITGGHDDAGEPMRHVAPLFGATHVIYEKGTARADLYAVYNGSIPYDRLAPSEKDKAYMYATDENGNPWSPGWFTLNFKASVSIMSWLDLTAGVENILDVRYRPYSSGIVAPGRNFIVSARLRI